MTLVVGTAGHIDHGKTTLLRALTGIDADRLPEERRRGMTIDVGYAHLDLDDGTSIDFVDVPGHDKLVGNMLVGAGEVDVAMLVVAADDGPRAQTLEHLALLDALGVAPGLVVITKIDAVEPERVAAVAAAVADLLAPTSLAGSPVLAASGVTGEGLDDGPCRARRPARGAPAHRPSADARDRPRVLGQGSWRRRDRHAPGRAARPGRHAPSGARRARRAGPRDPGPRDGRRRRGRRWAHGAQPRRDRGRRAAPRHGADGRSAGPGDGPGARHVRGARRGTGRAPGSTRERPRWMRPSVAPGATPWTSRTGHPRGRSAWPRRWPSRPGIVSCSGVALRWRRSAGSSSMSCRPVGSRDGARPWHGSRCSGPGSGARPGGSSSTAPCPRVGEPSSPRTFAPLPRPAPSPRSRTRRVSGPFAALWPKPCAAP